VSIFCLIESLGAAFERESIYFLIFKKLRYPVAFLGILYEAISAKLWVVLVVKSRITSESLG
jgi:hypothetical protein